MGLTRLWWTHGFVRRVAGPLALALVASAGMAPPAAAQAPAYLVKDLATGSSPVSSTPTAYVTIGATTFFQASAADTGQELWKTDGTPGGTVLVKDLYPGSVSGLALSAPFYASDRPEMVASNGVVLFPAQDGLSGMELYRSDGTAAGTTLVKDINPFGGAGVRRPTDVNGTLFFIADDGVHGAELWKSDGTAAGTVLVKDIVPGLTGSFRPLFSGTPEELVNLNGTLLFTVDDGVNGLELWRSDGTAAGTVLVKNIAPGSAGSDPEGLTPVNGVLFFAASDGVDGEELWKSDGTTAGTVLVKDVNPGSADGLSIGSGLTNVNGMLFFNGFTAASGGELWKSDGTTAGTVLVKDIVPGTDSSFPGDFAAFAGEVFFSASDSSFGTPGLWKSDGTAAGTVQVKDVQYPFKLTDVNGTLFFRGLDAANGIELWKSDGTTAGTVLLKDICPGSASAFDAINTSEELVNANGVLLLTADDCTSGAEPWRSDGTPAGTVRLSNIAVDVSGGAPAANASIPKGMIDVGGTLFFRGPGTSGNPALWKSDGTAAGTTLVASVGFPIDLGSAGGLAYFTTPGGGPGGSVHNLWRSDGTGVGTFQLSSGAGPVTDVNGVAFFRNGGIFAGPLELRKTNGTVAGTVVVRSFASASAMGNVTAANGTAFFTVSDASGTELWKSDGTTAGTVLVRDIHPTGSSDPSSMTDVNGTLFFTANDGTNGRELWKSDGTVAGTTMVANLAPGSASANVTQLTNVGGTLFFLLTDASNQLQLWKSDGTAAGTVPVKNIISSPGFPLVDVNGVVFFAAFDPFNGLELWKSDGTVVGTVLVKDLNPGPAFSFPSEMTSFAGLLVLRACDHARGCEIWESDGTAAGTFVAAEMIAGTGDGNPGLFTPVGSLLFFTAYTDATGRELWALPGGPTSTTTTSTTPTVTTTTSTLPRVCGAQPLGSCIGAGKSALHVNEKIAGKEKLTLTLKNLAPPVSIGDLGDPVAGSTRYAVCIYDQAGALVGQLVVDRAGQSCGAKPCWKTKGSDGYQLTDKTAASDGVRSLAAKAGLTGRGRVRAIGANVASKGQTALPTGIAAALGGNTQATVQVVTSDAACFGSVLTTVQKNSSLEFRGKSP